MSEERDEQRSRRPRREDDRRDDQDESLTIKAFGATIITSGRNLIIVVLLIAALATLGWAGWIHHTEMLAWEKRSEEQLTELIYVLSLTQERREALNISMPGTLRDKLRRQRRGEVD